MPRADYYDRLSARQQRLENAAERANANATAAFKRADMSEEATGIPFGQPILVGHHSEKRHRKTIDRAWAAMGKGVEESKKAAYYASAAEAVGTAGVSSDDPDGIEKLTEKAAELEAKQERMKAANEAWRKAGNKAGRNAEGVWVEPPYASYSLTNNGAKIRATKARIAHLQVAATAETKVIETNLGFQVVENADDNRVQIIFPGKPDQATRTILKSYGFRWAPTDGAWQRLLNNASRYAAQQVVRALTPTA